MLFTYLPFNEAICLDFLKDEWNPTLTLKAALLSIHALVSAPVPDDPQDAVVTPQQVYNLTHLSIFQSKVAHVVFEDRSKYNII